MRACQVAAVIALLGTQAVAAESYAARITDARNLLLNISVGKLPADKGNFEVFCQITASYTDFVVCTVLNTSNEPVGSISIFRGALPAEKALELVNRCAMPQGKPSCNILAQASLSEDNDILFKDFEIAKDYPYKFL